MAENIVLVDPKSYWKDWVQTLLEEAGKEVWIAKSNQNALDILQGTQAEILITALDTDESGLSLCQEISRLPVHIKPITIILSKVADVYMKVTCLKMGADDFLELPISKRYFMAKITAYERILSSFKQSPLESLLTIDQDRFTVIHKNKSYSLPKKEFEILSLLNDGKAKVFSRDEIRNSVWKSPGEVNNRTVDVYIRKIRSRLGSEVIQTVKGVGYKVV